MVAFHYPSPQRPVSPTLYSNIPHYTYNSLTHNQPTNLQFLTVELQMQGANNTILLFFGTSKYLYIINCNKMKEGKG